MNTLGAAPRLFRLTSLTTQELSLFSAVVMAAVVPVAPRYASFDPAAEINGDSVRAVLASLFMPQQGREILARHGLPVGPLPGQWYPMQAWLNILAEAEDRFGPAPCTRPAC